MGEPPQAPPGSQGILLDIGGNIGALVVAAAEPLLGREIEAGPAAAGATRVHAVVHQRWAGGRPLFAAVFPALAQGDYELRQGGQTLGQVTITGGQVTQVALTTPAIGGQPAPGHNKPRAPRGDKPI